MGQPWPSVPSGPESVGASHICVHDHLTNRHPPITLLTAVAMATARIGLCPLVFNNELRHPAVLAQSLLDADSAASVQAILDVLAAVRDDSQVR